MKREKLSEDEFARRLREAKLFSLDVDGVLTDGALHYHDDGTEVKVFNVRDGTAVQLVVQHGLPVAIVSASVTPLIRIRARNLGVQHVYTGARDKVAAIEEICAKIGATLADVIHVADDVNDIPLLERVGLPIAVADATPEVIARAVYVTRSPGGKGAVRELCEAILKGRDAWPY